MIHFVTIVLNGMPFITRHLPIFRNLKVPWLWHVIEGPAAPHYDTAWCKMPPEDSYQNFMSLDGTAEYLNAIASHQVRVYRKDGLWNGKVEMVNAPISEFQPGDLIHQIDVDEFWTRDQLERITKLHPGIGAIQYDCVNYVGPQLRVFGAPETGEWVRTWRFVGHSFSLHEPPHMPHDGRFMNRRESIAHNLVFQHYGYVLESQVAFKEKYYGIRGLLDDWKRLQNNKTWPVKLRDFMQVGDGWVEHVDTPLNLHRLDCPYYSEYGEDAWIDANINLPENGVWVDVGANHPVSGSNTAFLRDRGWTGLAIDAHPEIAALWGSSFICAVVSPFRNVQFDFRSLISHSRINAVHGATIAARRLDEILDTIGITSIDLLSVDVEGHEFWVFQSFNINKYQPKVIIAEYDTHQIGQDYRLKEFLLLHGYKVVHQTIANMIYSK